MSHLSVCAGGIVQYDLRLHNAGSQLVICLTDDLVIVIFCHIVVNCKSLGGQQAHRHQHNHQQ